MSMIINTQTKGYQMQSTRNYPENWEGEGWLPVPPELEGKVRENYPYYELVIRGRDPDGAAGGAGGAGAAQRGSGGARGCAGSGAGQRMERAGGGNQGRGEQR